MFAFAISPVLATRVVVRLGFHAVCLTAITLYAVTPLATRGPPRPTAQLNRDFACLDGPTSRSFSPLVTRTPSIS